MDTEEISCVNADVAGLFNVGDEIFIHQGEIEVMYIVTNVAIAPGETCLDEDGNPNTFYVYVDGNFVQDFGSPLMAGAMIRFDDNDGGDNPCTDGTLNCENLHLIGVVGPETIKEIIDLNINNEDTNLPYNIDDLAAMALISVNKD